MSDKEASHSEQFFASLLVELNKRTSGRARSTPVEAKKTKKFRKQRNRATKTKQAVLRMLEVDEIDTEPIHGTFRQSTGTFDCVGLNTLSFSPLRRQQLPIAQGFTPTSASLKRQSKFFSTSIRARRLSKSTDPPAIERMSISPTSSAEPAPPACQDYPPPPSGRTNRRIILIVDAHSRQIIKWNDEALCIFGLDTCADFYRLFPRRYMSWAEAMVKAAIDYGPAIATNRRRNSSPTERGFIIDTGKLMEIYDRDRTQIGVCAYSQIIPTSSMTSRMLLLVFERSYKFEAACTVNLSNGLVEDHDLNFAIMFGADENRLTNRPLSDLLKISGRVGRDRNGHRIPINPITYLKHIVKMESSITGLTLSGIVFPVLVTAIGQKGQDLLKLKLQEFTNICGLIIIDEKGDIVDYNCTLIRLLFGYADHCRTLDGDVVCPLRQQHISVLIPDYQKILSSHNHAYRVIEPHLHDGIYRSEIEDSISCAKLVSGTLERLDGTDPHIVANALGFNSPFAKDRNQPPAPKPPLKRKNPDDFRKEAIMRNVAAMKTPRRPISAVGDGISPRLSSKKRTLAILASNPVLAARKFMFQEGSFSGMCRHRNGSSLRANYIVSRIPSGYYAIWVRRSEDDPHAFELQEAVMIERIKQLKDSSPIADLVSEHASYQDLYEDLFEVTRGRFGPLFVSRAKYGQNLVPLVTRYLESEEMDLVRIHMVTIDKPMDQLEGIKHQQPKTIPYGLKVLYELRKHPCFVRLIDVFEDNGYFKYVSHLHGDQPMDLHMFTMMRATMDEGLASFIFRQIVSAVDYLHNEIGCCCRNLRADNVCINSAFRVKLTDLSYAHPIELCSECWDVMIVGGLDYCPPEALLNGGYEPKAADIWALGVILYLVLFGFMPFKDPDMIVSVDRTYPCLISTSLQDLLGKLFRISKDERIGSEELLKHSWTCFDIDLCEYQWENVMRNADAMAQIEYGDYQKERLGMIIDLPECRNAPAQFKPRSDASDSDSGPIEHHQNEPDGDFKLLGLINPIDECRFENSISDVLNKTILNIDIFDETAAVNDIEQMDDYEDDDDDDDGAEPKKRKSSIEDCQIRGFVGKGVGQQKRTSQNDVHINCCCQSPSLLNKTFRGGDDLDDCDRNDGVREFNSDQQIDCDDMFS